MHSQFDSVYMQNKMKIGESSIELQELLFCADTLLIKGRVPKHSNHSENNFKALPRSSHSMNVGKLL